MLSLTESILREGKYAQMDKWIPVAKDILEIHIKKNKDYGKESDPFFNFRISANLTKTHPSDICRLHMANKLARIKSLESNNREPENEPLRDSYLDMANYGCIAVSLSEHQAMFSIRDAINSELEERIGIDIPEKFKIAESIISANTFVDFRKKDLLFTLEKSLSKPFSVHVYPSTILNEYRGTMLNAVGSSMEIYRRKYHPRSDEEV